MKHNRPLFDYTPDDTQRQIDMMMAISEGEMGEFDAKAWHKKLKELVAGAPKEILFTIDSISQ